MREWKKYTLGELYKVSSGLSKGADQFGFGETFISFKDVFGNYFLPENPNGLVNSNEKDQKTCSVNYGDILLTRTSEIIEEVGMSSVALKDYPNSTFNGFCKRLRPKEDAPIGISPLYMGYLLRTRFFRKTVANYATMTTRASLNGESIKEIPLSFPSIETQEEIGKTLYCLEKKIALLKKQSQTLEELAQTLFKRWFVDFEFPLIKKDGTLSGAETYKSSGGKMIASELGEIPEGWSVGSLGSSIETVGGGTPSTTEASYWTNGTIFWYSPTDLTKSKSVFSDFSAKKITELGLQKSSAKIFPPYSILMSSRATVGEITINTNEASTNQGFITLIPNDNFSVYFLYDWLKTKLKDVHNLASGSTFPEISKTDFRGLEIIIPNKSISVSYNLSTKPIFNHLENNSKEIQSLTQLRDTLLPKLMSGSLEIKTENE